MGSVFFDVSAQETLQSADNVPDGPKRHTCSAANKENPDRILMICRFFYQNQYSFISDKNSVVIGNPEYAPITESIPQYGHNAVPFVSFIQNFISLGLKIFKQ